MIAYIVTGQAFPGPCGCPASSKIADLYVKYANAHQYDGESDSFFPAHRLVYHALNLTLQEFAKTGANTPARGYQSVKRQVLNLDQAQRIPFLSPNHTAPNIRRDDVLNRSKSINTGIIGHLSFLFARSPIGRNDIYRVQAAMLLFAEQVDFSITTITQSAHTARLHIRSRARLSVC